MNKAFTLLEIMVVLAILAILSTAAIPVYKAYLLRAKLATARQYADNFNGEISQYYSDHGTFPTNTDLNVSSAIPASVAEYLYAPYLAYMTVAPQSATAGQCPYGISTAYFSNYAGDYYADGNSRYVTLYNYFIDNNGTMDILCAYNEFDPGTNNITTSVIFPDCIQTADPNSSSIMNLINTACA